MVHIRYGTDINSNVVPVEYDLDDEYSVLPLNCLYDYIFNYICNIIGLKYERPYYVTRKLEFCVELIDDDLYIRCDEIEHRIRHSSRPLGPNGTVDCYIKINSTSKDLPIIEFVANAKLWFCNNFEYFQNVSIDTEHFESMIKVSFDEWYEICRKILRKI